MSPTNVWIFGSSFVLCCIPYRPETDSPVSPVICLRLSTSFAAVSLVLGAIDIVGTLRMPVAVTVPCVGQSVFRMQRPLLLSFSAALICSH